MQRSQRADILVQGFEALRLVGFRPTPNDVPTNGWGHTGPDVLIGQVWTREHADEVYAADAALRDQQLAKQLYGIPTRQGQWDAMFSLLYNIGFDNFRTSTLLRKHKAGDYAGASAEFPKWDHQAGKVLPGLLRRRLAEQALYNS